MFTDMSSLEHDSSDTASPPAKRQLYKTTSRTSPDKQRAGRGQVPGSPPGPPPSVADQPLPTKSTQTENLPDPSTLAESLSTSIELNDDSNLNAEEQRRLEDIIRFNLLLITSGPYLGYRYITLDLLY